jgi:hypothetical protein
MINLIKYSYTDEGIKSLLSTSGLHEQANNPTTLTLGIFSTKIESVIPASA